MIISVINLAKDFVSDADLQQVVRAVNRQIAEDFEPYWGFGARLRLEGRSGRRGAGVEPADMRGDAILYLYKPARLSDADGYHDRYSRGIPYGYVFLEVSKALKEDWTITFSHEALELLGDPENNLFVQGPHPTRNRMVFHWFEMCDAVQDESYSIDGVQVSNFLLPLYFTSSNERGGRNDFLGSFNNGKTLESFSVNPGGYIGFFDPHTGKDTTWSPKADRRSAERLAIKQKLRTGRGNLRLMRTEQKLPAVRTSTRKREAAT